MRQLASVPFRITTGGGLGGSLEGGGGRGEGSGEGGPPLLEDDNISWAPGTPPDQDFGFYLVC